MGDREAFLRHIRMDPDQVNRVHAALSGGRWWTKAALAEAVGGSTHSMSARMSDLRKLGAVLERKYAGSGVYLYRMTVSPMKKTNPCKQKNRSKTPLDASAGLLHGSHSLNGGDIHG